MTSTLSWNQTLHQTRGDSIHLIMGFIDTMRTQGRAVESFCRVLREQGFQVAVRTYREWKRPCRPVAARTVNDAHVVDVLRSLAWTNTTPDGRPRMTPEGLYGRRLGW